MSDATPEPLSKTTFQFGNRLVLAVVAVLCVFFAGYGWFHRSFITPRRHSDSIHRMIESLVNRRPDDMTQAQWGSAVAWTLNLHSNSLLSLDADASTIAAFETRLEGRLAGDVDMQTIHWIWDEYADLCPHGAGYQRFKAQMLEEIDAVGPKDDPWGMNVP